MSASYQNRKKAKKLMKRMASRINDGSPENLAWLEQANQRLWSRNPRLMSIRSNHEAEPIRDPEAYRVIAGTRAPNPGDEPAEAGQ